MTEAIEVREGDEIDVGTTRILLISVRRADDAGNSGRSRVVFEPAARPGTWLLAVARGFGQVGGTPTESALLARLRAECQRRMRSPRFRRAIDRPQAAATALLAILARVNGALYASTASHDDYVTAASSLTAVLVVQGVAYVIHAGATAAYLARAGDVVPLCEDDAMDDRPVAVLARAFAVAPVLDVVVTNARLVPGDAIVLLGRR